MSWWCTSRCLLSWQTWWVPGEYLNNSSIRALSHSQSWEARSLAGCHCYERALISVLCRSKVIGVWSLCYFKSRVGYTEILLFAFSCEHVVQVTPLLYPIKLLQYQQRKLPPRLGVLQHLLPVSKGQTIYSMDKILPTLLSLPGCRHAAGILTFWFLKPWMVQNLLLYKTVYFRHMLMDTLTLTSHASRNFHHNSAQGDRLHFCCVRGWMKTSLPLFSHPPLS